MNHALFLNVLIIAAIMVALVMLNNPLALLGLLLLRDMPFGLLAPPEPEEQSSAIGFID